MSDDHITVGLDIAGASAEAVIEAFCRRELVSRWWGGELTIERRVGGAYVVDFARLDATLRGTIRGYAPAGPLSFTWRWDGEEDEFLVTVRALRRPDGVRVEVEHGPYADLTGEDATSHREGWEYFLPRLAAVLSARRREQIQ